MTLWFSMGLRSYESTIWKSTTGRTLTRRFTEGDPEAAAAAGAAAGADPEEGGAAELDIPAEATERNRKKEEVRQLKEATWRGKQAGKGSAISSLSIPKPFSFSRSTGGAETHLAVLLVLEPSAGGDTFKYVISQT